MESRREKDEIREKVWRVGERVEEIESRIKARERERD
jgi:hypothetical protein